MVPRLKGKELAPGKLLPFKFGWLLFSTTQIVAQDGSMNSSSLRLIFKHARRSFSTAERANSPLLDTFGRFHNYLRISLTEKCNLRCVYCMPEEGVQLTPKQNLMSLAERKRLISLFASLGVDKLRFTGGEPTVSTQLEELIQHASSCNIKSIGITSNGLILKERLDGLIKAGLTSVNISLDTLVDTKFAQITRRDKKNIFRVLSSVYTAVSKGLPVKINCVLMRDFNDSEISDFVELTKAVNVDCRFIELMPFDGNEWNPKKFVSYGEVVDRLAAEKNIHLTKEPPSNPRFDRSDTTKWYRASPDHLGRVGFITSMSSNFCGTCNRLRVTADGNLKVCLFGADGFDLLASMRAGESDAEIGQKLGEAVRLKKNALGGHKTPSEIASNSTGNRPMILIGG